MSMESCCDGPFDNHLLYQTLRMQQPLSFSIWKKRLLNLSDTFISLFVVGPLTIAYWRGTWGWMDEYPHIYQSTSCFLFGALIHFCFCMLRELLHTKYRSFKRQRQVSMLHSFYVFIGKRIYTYLFSIGCIMHW